MATHAATIDASVFSDAKRELTPMQQAFVDEYVSNGGKLKAAALKAGYATGSAATEASRLVRNPLVQQAITKATLVAIGLHAAPALKRIADLSRSAKSQYVQLEASRDLLDRAGFRPPDRHHIQLDTDLSVTLDLAPRTVEGGQKLED